MYRVVEISGNVLNGSERERFSDAIHLARETEHMEAELETEYYVQVQQKGEWKAVDNADFRSVVTENKNGTLYSFSGLGTGGLSFLPFRLFHDTLDSRVG